MPQSSPMPEAYCLTCGYRLDTFATPPRCPECGGEFDPDDPATVRTPCTVPISRKRQWLMIVLMMLVVVGIMLLITMLDGSLLQMGRAY